MCVEFKTQRGSQIAVGGFEGVGINGERGTEDDERCAVLRSLNSDAHSRAEAAFFDLFALPCNGGLEMRNQQVRRPHS